MAADLFIHFEWISLAVHFFFLKSITLATRTGGDLFRMADWQPFEQLNIFSERITLAV